MFSQELKQDSDSTAVLGRKRFQRDRTTLATPRAHHQQERTQGERVGGEGPIQRTENVWGKSENDLELNHGKFSKLVIRFVVGD